MSSKKNCRITKVEALTKDITSFEIEVLDDSFERNTFDNLEAGSHLDVYFNDGLIRQYSLWDWSEDKTRVSIAVKREDQGNGGSIQMHQFKVDNLITIDGPRNNFKLIPNKPHYTLIAGGIGVTPIFAMARELVAQKASFDVYYLVQKEELAAFSSHFEKLGLNDIETCSYNLHCDDQNGFVDFDSLIKNLPDASVIYTCGPEPMLNKIIETVDATASNHKKSHELHFERFTLASEETEKENKPFEVKINSTGAIYTVNENDTILTVLAENGVDVASACAQGLCGTCITDVLEGEIDHRDGILSDDEKASNETICVCISRAKSSQITLDL
ncbi:UNVERIFIED_CONTAM: hypothetical protein GTU68_007227 [Idotea baltica]|nr:hypothetical protein [Idotea baltica]